MQLSVVVPTLNRRDQLATTLDAIAEHAPGAEVVVANGPSADGTTGMVREREDVAVLVETADRSVNAARNAGIEHASGDAVAFVNPGVAVSEGWREAIETGLSGADVTTGPVHEQLRGGKSTDVVESRTIAGREVTYLNGANCAFTREALSALDGFDEYLDVGGARDCAHRLAELDYAVSWQSGMDAERPVGTDGGVEDRDWGWKYRSLAYRLAKNYGLRPTVVRRLVCHAGSDALASIRDVVRGDGTLSDWLGTGRTVAWNAAVGVKDGRWARTLDRTRRRNPYGVSTRSDRAVAVYDRR